MDENLHDIEDLFHAALNDNEEVPSQRVWDNLEKRLDNEHINKLRGKYNSLKKISLVLLLLLCFTVYEMYKKGSTPKFNAGSLENTPVSANSGTTNKKNNTSDNESSKIGLTPGKQKSHLNTLEKPSFSPNASTNENESNTVNSRQQTVQNSYAEGPGAARNKNPRSKPFFTNSRSNKVRTHPLITAMVQNASVQKEKNSNSSPNNREAIRTVHSLEITSSPTILERLYPSNGLVQANEFPFFNLLLQGSLTSVENKNGNKKGLNSNSHSKPFYITPFFSPDFAWYRLQDDNVGNQPGSASQLEKEEKHEFSYTFGVLAEVPLNKHFSIESGITLANTNLTLEPEYVYAQPDNSGIVKYRINTSSGYGYVLPSFSPNPAPGDSLYMYTAVHSLQYFGIPASVKYSINWKKFTLSLRAGLSANFLTKAKLEVNLENGSSKATETIYNLNGIRNLYFSGLAGGQIDYPVNKSIAFSLMPTFRFAISSIDKNATVRSYPMTFGIIGGLRINF